MIHQFWVPVNISLPRVIRFAWFHTNPTSMRLFIYFSSHGCLSWMTFHNCTLRPLNRHRRGFACAASSSRPTRMGLSRSPLAYLRLFHFCLLSVPCCFCVVYITSSLDPHMQLHILASVTTYSMYDQHEQNHPTFFQDKPKPRLSVKY